MFPYPSFTTIFKNTLATRNILVALMLSTLALLFSTTLTQAGGLVVSPSIIEFDGRQRYAKLILVNQDTKTHCYRISFINKRMREDGELVDTDHPAEGEGFSDKFLRFSPRQVTLEPGIPQTVRVMMRLPAGVKDGEYRSHMLFQQLPDTGKPQKQEGPLYRLDDEN